MVRFCLNIATNMEINVQIEKGLNAVEGKPMYAYDIVVGYIKSYDSITGIAIIKN